MTVQDCSGFLDVSDRVIYSAIKSKSLPSFRFGPQTIKIRRSDFLKWIEKAKTA